MVFNMRLHRVFDISWLKSSKILFLCFAQLETIKTKVIDNIIFINIDDLRKYLGQLISLAFTTISSDS